jgi:outer membrane protein assembly factor BamB
MGRAVRGAVVAGLLVVAATGCDTWIQQGATGGHARYNRFEKTLTAANVATLDDLWSVDVLAETPEPMVDDDRVYLVTAEHAGPTTVEARALDAASGAELWTRPLLSHPEAASEFWMAAPAFVAGQLWFGYNARNPVAGWRDNTYGGLARADGTTTFESFSVPAPGGDFVESGQYMVLLDASAEQHSLYIKLKNLPGGGEWSVLFPASTPAFHGPSVAGGQIFVTNGSVVHAFLISGCNNPPGPICATQWTHDVGTTLGKAAVVDGGSQVFVATDAATGNELVALARDTGAALWRAPLASSVPDIAATGTSVYVADGSTLKVYAAGGCGAATCDPVWTADLGAPATSAPTVANDVVYVGTQGAVHALPAAGCGAASCAEIAGVATPGSPSSIVVTGGRLFTVGGGKLTAYAPAAPTP